MTRQSLELKAGTKFDAEYEAVFTAPGCYDLNRITVMMPRSHAKVVAPYKQLLIIE